MEGKSKIQVNILTIALTIQLGVFASIFANSLHMSIPIIRYVIVFLYLSFLPGLLIINILRINLKFIEIILFSFGLSLLFVVVSSLCENEILLSLNIENPLSEMYLTLFYGIIILSIILVSKWRGCKFITFDRPHSLNLNYIAILFFPVFSLFGGVILRYNGNNLFLLFVLTIISIIPIFSLRLPEKYYPLIIWVVSISLLIHTNLSYAGKSLYETYLSGVVYTAGVWDSLYPDELNSLLTTSLMLPVFSKMMGIDIIWGVHIISWIMMSFIPVLMYEIHSKFNSCKIALLSSFLYIFMPFYYTQEWVMFAQRTAFTLFFISLFLLLIFSDIEAVKMKVLSSFCLLPIIMSHYGAAYFFLISLSVSMILKKIFKVYGLIHFNTFCLYSALLFSWYIYTSSSENLFWIRSVLLDVWANLSEFLQPSGTYALDLIFSTNSLSIEVAKNLNLLVVFLSFIGALAYTKEMLLKKSTEYGILCVSPTLILFTQILPHVVGSNRLFSMILIFSSPLCVFSFLFLLKPFKLDKNQIFNIFCIFLLIFFIFGSGVSSNIINKISGKTIDYSVNRQMDRLAIQRGDGIGKWNLYWTYRLDSTIDATDWFTIHNSGKPIYVDWCLYNHFITHEGTSNVTSYYNSNYREKKIYEKMMSPNLKNISVVLSGTEPLKKGDYIFLAHHNTIENSIVSNEQTVLKTSNYSKTFNSMDCIYNNGGDFLLR